MIFFSGDVAREKISKICGHFGATLYKYPETSEHGEMLTEVIKRIAESDEVMASGEPKGVESYEVSDIYPEAFEGAAAHSPNPDPAPDPNPDPSP